MRPESRERWRQRGRELKRRAWRWDAGGHWALLAIATAGAPIGAFALVFAPGDTDRLGAAALLGIGIATALGLVVYLDRKSVVRSHLEHMRGMGDSQRALTGDEIRRARFRQSMRGYDPGEVDAALSEIANSVDFGLLRTEAEIRALRFHQRMRGYDPDEVDAFLDRLIGESSE